MDTRFGTVKGLSERRRLPLLGKIRLGIKKQNTQGKTYPKETDYFVVPEEVKAVYGDQPKELDIMFPVTDRNLIFPTAYRWYGSTKGLKCIGNGEVAKRLVNDKDEMEITEIECPCSKGEHVEGKRSECNVKAFLMVMLPKVSMGGVYQICTGSINSIIDVNSGLDYTEALIGRVNMVPLKIRRTAIETHNDGQKQTHYTLKVIYDGDINLLNQLRENTKRIMLEAKTIALPPPKDENPEEDPVDVVDPETGEVTENDRPISEEQKEELRKLFTKNKLTKDSFTEMLITKYEKTSVASLTFSEADSLINQLSQ